MDTVEGTTGTSRNPDNERLMASWPRLGLLIVDCLKVFVPNLPRTFKGEINVFMRINTSELEVISLLTTDLNNVVGGCRSQRWGEKANLRMDYKGDYDLKIPKWTLMKVYSLEVKLRHASSISKLLVQNTRLFS